MKTVHSETAVYGTRRREGNTELMARLQVHHMLVGTQLDTLPITEGRETELTSATSAILKQFLGGFEAKSVTLGGSHPDPAKHTPNLAPDYVYMTKDISVKGLAVDDARRQEDNARVRKRLFQGNGFVLEVFSSTDVPKYVLCHYMRTSTVRGKGSPSRLRDAHASRFNHMSDKAEIRAALQARALSPSRKTKEPYIPLAPFLNAKPPPQSVVRDASYLISIPDPKSKRSLKPAPPAEPLPTEKPHCPNDMHCLKADDRNHLDTFIHPCPRYYESGVCHLESEHAHVTHFSHRLRRSGVVAQAGAGKMVSPVKEVTELATPIPPTPLPHASPLQVGKMSRQPPLKHQQQQQQQQQQHPPLRMAKDSLPVFVAPLPAPESDAMLVGASSYNATPVASPQPHIAREVVDNMVTLSPPRPMSRSPARQESASPTDWREMFQETVIELSSSPVGQVVNRVPPSMRKSAPPAIDTPETGTPVMVPGCSEDGDSALLPEPFPMDGDEHPPMRLSYFPLAKKRGPISTVPLGPRAYFKPTRANAGIPEPSSRPKGSVSRTMPQKSGKQNSSSPSRRHRCPSEVSEVINSAHLRRVG